jgi:hypothetical protein
MGRLLLILFLSVGVSYDVPACENKQKHSVEDVVFNHVTPETIEIDRQLQASYECKYVFAMLLDSTGYEPMHLLSGTMPDTPTDAQGNRIAGVVLIGFVLQTIGTPSDPVVLKSDDERLAKIALEHVVGLKFRAARFKGRAVRALGLQVYGFE